MSDANSSLDDNYIDDDDAMDVCVHGKPFSSICVECCPEDDDGSFEGDEWSEA